MTNPFEEEIRMVKILIKNDLYYKEIREGLCSTLQILENLSEYNLFKMMRMSNDPVFTTLSVDAIQRLAQAILKGLKEGV